MLSATLQSDASLKNALLVFEYKSALNKKTIQPEVFFGWVFVFFLKVSEFHPFLSRQIIRLLKRIIQLCANWSMTLTFTDLQISDILIFMSLRLHFYSHVITSEKSGSAALEIDFTVRTMFATIVV